jgi:hypothetical protein
MSKVDNFITEWKKGVIEENHDIIESLFAEKAQFCSPVVNQIYKDKKIIFQILKWIIKIFGKDFKYTQEYTNQKEMTVCLLFESNIKDPKSNKMLKVEGVDLFKLDENGKVIELKVMLRPLNSTLIIANQMKNNFLGSKL